MKNDLKCVSCRRCLCQHCHPDGPCEHVNRGRRIFLLGALLAPVAPKLVRPAMAAIDTETTGRILANRVVINGQEWSCSSDPPTEGWSGVPAGGGLVYV